MTTLLLMILGLLGCKEDDSPEVLLPSNLNLTVEIAGDGSGAVSVSATAQDANFYNFYFGEIDNETPVRSAEGVGEYTYAESGSYTIRVQAHTTEADFISAEKEVNIEIEEDLNIPAAGYTTPETYDGWTLVWQDEFEGQELNAADWSYEIGTGANGWGNNELQYYRQENTAVQDGYLIIEAREENFGDREYTSSRIITKDKRTFQYGRIDIRAALPVGQGIWPALWMLGSTFPTDGWPSCGEIDIMEMIGGSGRENTVHGTLHWDNNGHASNGGGYTLSSGIFADEFHVFSIIWDEDKITWFVDDEQFHVIDITPESLSEFHNSFFFIFNVAVGGNWPGSPNEATTFPQRLIVDYVRVFQKE